jgi:hypothetical protein
MSKHVFYLYWCYRQKSISTKIEEEIKFDSKIIRLFTYLEELFPFRWDKNGTHSSNHKY